MNSLEFINREIKKLEERKESAFKNEYYSIYKECSQKITALQQIKSLLEILELLKPQLDLEYQDGEDDRFMIGLRKYIELKPHQTSIIKEFLNNE